MVRPLSILCAGGLACAVVWFGFGCGARSTLDSPDAIAILPDGAVACGDGFCDPSVGENCSTCFADCGKCATCGDGTCQTTESCSSCPGDCGTCPTCPDGYCNGTEDCESCAADCGECPGCGDKKCDAKTETCFTCPEDCGACPTCGDGKCCDPAHGCDPPTETCASCEIDCGPCTTCGNGKCEGPYETCTNCPGDCGTCPIIGSCIDEVTCDLGCIDRSTDPPTFSVTCIGDCVARGCAKVGYAVDQVLDCALANFDKCPGGLSISCLTKVCDKQIATCIGAICS